jgi:hypothetical protein
MTSCFQIQRRSDGAVFSPKWGATGFKKTGKSYATAGHARSAWKNHISQDHQKHPEVELVEYKTVEVRRGKL